VPDWHAEPFAVNELAASYFDDSLRFPRGSIAFDHALVMRNIEHEWRLREPIANAAAGGLHWPLSNAAPTPLEV
jgi:hypothetical protein